MPKIPVGATVAHALRFAMRDFFRVLGVMWLPMLVSWTPGIFLHTGPGRPSPLILLIDLIALILLFMQFIGIAQLALATKRGPGWIYFSLGKPVWRFIGCLLFLILLTAMGGLAAVFGTSLLVSAQGMVSRGIASTVLAFPLHLAIVAAIAAIWCALFYGYVRLSFLLLPVIAAQEPEFAITRSWTLGAGNFWRMIALILTVMVPLVLVECAVMFGYVLRGVSIQPQSADQKAAFQHLVQTRLLDLMQGFNHNWYVTYPAMLAVAAFVYGYVVATQVFAYRSLTSDPIAGHRLPD